MTGPVPNTNHDEYFPFQSEHADIEDRPEKAVDPFEKILQGSCNLSIDPLQCVPLVYIRAIAKCGAERLARMFDGEATTSGMIRGHSSSGALPVVVKLASNQRNIVLKHLTEKMEMSSVQALEHYNSKQNWYGIVDGCHRHAALCSLMDCKPEKWLGYVWWVTVICEQRLEVLQAFARDRNEKQRKDCIVDFTLYDTLRNMKEVAQRYLLNHGIEVRNPNNLRRGAITEIADAYCGAKGSANSTSRQVVGVVLRLSSDVIKCIGEIMNTEYPDLAFKQAQMRAKRNKRVCIDTNMLDTRVFRTLFNTSTLRSAALFKSDTTQESDRIHALRRCRFRALDENLKSISGLLLDEEVQNAKAARKEVEKMNKLFGGNPWPPALETVKKNLLETTKLDDQVKSNIGEDRNILPRLKELYQSHGGYQASQRIHLFTAVQLNVRNQTPITEEDTTGIADNTPSEGLNNSSNAHETTNNLPKLPSVQDQDDIDLNRDGESREQNLLQRYGVSTYNMTWQKYYDSVVRSGEQVIVDMILTDPPYSLPNSRVKTGRGYRDNIDEKEMELFSQFARHILVPGGYCVIFTSFHLFTKWKMSLEAEDFVVTNVPIVFAKKSTMLQKSSSNRYPQNATEFGLVARLRGNHPKKFMPNFQSPYRLVKCSHSRKFSIIDNVIPVRRRLLIPGTKRPVRVEEKSPLLLAELLTTYCPDNGLVLDAYAGTLTTAMACLATDRSCISIEEKEDCYSMALSRLKKVAGHKEQRENFEELQNINPSTVYDLLNVAASPTQNESSDDDNEDSQDMMDSYSSEENSRYEGSEGDEASQSNEENTNVIDNSCTD